MTKELQNQAWSVLPKEFKEEVKKIYNADDPLVCREENELLDYIFGEHNLTSDAEGEEMLTVSRKRVQEMFAHYDKICNDPNRPKDYIESVYEYADGVTMALDDLFGSKCLPDNVESSEPNVDSLPQNPTENCDNKSHISADCNKPAEPKFTKGDMVHCKSFGYEGDYKVLEYTGGPRNCYDCIDKYGTYYRFYESDLEPYTEMTDFGREVNFPTKNNLAIYLKKSQNCDKRPQIAAMAMQGILSNIDLFKNVLSTGMETLSGDGISYRAVAKASLLFADDLMNEAEKGVEE